MFITFSSNKIDSKKYGILFSQNVTVKSAPTENGTNLFSLHLGAKIEIIDEVGEWIKIRIANGNSGWITKNNYRLLLNNYLLFIVYLHLKFLIFIFWVIFSYIC